MRAYDLVVVDREQSANRRIQPQGAEVRSRDEQPLPCRRFIANRDIGTKVLVRRDSREHCLRAFEIAKHRVAEDLLAITGLRALRRAGLRPRRAQIHEARWLGYREWAQQHLIKERVDRSICTDTESERDDGNRGHQRGLEQHADSKFHVTHLTGAQKWRLRRGASTNGANTMTTAGIKKVCTSRSSDY